MATVQDRWFVERRNRDGSTTRVPTQFHGSTSIKRWRVHYRTPAGEQRNRCFAKKVIAEQFAVTVESAKLDGEFVDPKRARVTFGEVAGAWRAGKIGVKPSTGARYDSALDVHILPKWRATPLRAVDHAGLQAWIGELHEAGQSGASIRKVITVLSGVMELAVRTKRAPSNPARGLELPATGVREHRYLTARQVEVMAAAAATIPQDAPRRTSDEMRAQYRLVVLTLAYCGLRWSELAGLRVRRLDLQRRRLRVAQVVVEVDGADLAWGTPKSHEARTVPIPRFLAAELEAHVQGRAPEDLVFTAPGGGVLRNRNARRAWFNRAAAETGVAGLTPHELRHTAASLAVSAGANIKALSRMLGHKSAAMTLDTYAELFDDDLAAVADRLDDLREIARVARPLHAASTGSGAAVADGP